MDLQKDVLAWMGFVPMVSASLRCMDARIFCEAPMRLREDMAMLRDTTLPNRSENAIA